MNIQQGIHWPRSEPVFRTDDHDSREPVNEQIPKDIATLIGQWYFYISHHDKEIHLCRTRGDVELPFQAEIVKQGDLAISDDDLECAVLHQSGGTFDSGCYGISPLIERKLRILYE